MATTIPSAAVVPTAPVFTNTQRLALAGFLAGYSGLTRQTYELDLRQFAAWCQQHQLRLFQARRSAAGWLHDVAGVADVRERAHQVPVGLAGRGRFR